MKIEKFDADTFMILDAPALDPITVIIRNHGNRRGQLIIVCFGAAWSTYWGSMFEETVQEFLGGVHPSYVVDCLIQARREFITNRKAVGREVDYLKRIVSAVQEAVKLPEPASSSTKCEACKDELCGGTGIYDGRKCDGIPF